MDTGAVERDLEGCRRKLKDLDASLARLESCRRELVARLGELLSPDGPADGSRPGCGSADGGQPGGAASPGGVGHGVPCHQRSGRDPSGATFPSTREEEVDCCLEMLKLRCQDMAEELAEVVLLAEALHALARKKAATAGAGGPAAAGAPALAAAPSDGAPAPGASPAAGPPAPAAPPASPPPAAPGPEGLAAIISSPQFQKVAAQLLAQLIRK